MTPLPCRGRLWCSRRGALALALTAALGACHAAGGDGSGGSGAAGPAVDANAAAALPTGSGIRWLGRVQAMDAADPTHVRLSWPGVALGVHFVGSSLAVVAQDDAHTFLTGGPFHSRWDVRVDGGAPTTVAFDTTEQSIALAEDLAPGEHTVWLSKRTEAQFGATEIFALQLGDGGRLLSPPPARPRRLEVVGSSVETGYGIEAINCTGLRDDQQNQNKAWPQLTADQLGAELANLSYSGKGMATNLDVVNDRHNTVPVLYRLAEPMSSSSTWAFSAPPPDVVVIDVGGNDWQAAGGPPDADAFHAAFLAFVQNEVLAHAPEAWVYLTVNPISYDAKRAWLQAAYQRVVDALAQAGNARAAVFVWDPYLGADKACDGHPPAPVHVEMAATISARIRTDLGWATP